MDCKLKRCNGKKTQNVNQASKKLMELNQNSMHGGACGRKKSVINQSTNFLHAQAAGMWKVPKGWHKDYSLEN